VVESASAVAVQQDTGAARIGGIKVLTAKAARVVTAKPSAAAQMGFPTEDPESTGGEQSNVTAADSADGGSGHAVVGEEKRQTVHEFSKARDEEAEKEIEREAGAGAETEASTATVATAPESIDAAVADAAVPDAAVPDAAVPDAAVPDAAVAADAAVADAALADAAVAADAADAAVADAAVANAAVAADAAVADAAVPDAAVTDAAVANAAVADAAVADAAVTDAAVPDASPHASVVAAVPHASAHVPVVATDKSAAIEPVSVTDPVQETLVTVAEPVAEETAPRLQESVSSLSDLGGGDIINDHMDAPPSAKELAANLPDGAEVANFFTDT
jgi:hypothetical protein